MIAPILKVERKLGETVFYVCFMTFVLNLVDHLSNLLGPQFNEYCNFEQSYFEIHDSNDFCDLKFK
jgi:hypothetical protein